MAPLSFFSCFENRIETRVKQHLKNVYGALTMTCCAASIGAYIEIFTDVQAGLLAALVSLSFMSLLFITSDDNGKNTNLRLCYLIGFGFTTGMGLGPLLNNVMDVDQAVVMTALLGSTIIFVSLSAAAILADRNSWLFLICPLTTMFATMILLSLLNVFVNSNYIYQIELYLGLMVMCGFVLFDTQLIIEKRRRGSKDFVTHALELFIDFVGTLRRILVVLTEKEKEQRRRKGESNNNS